MENYLAVAALNGMDRRSLQRSARLGQEVLERAKRRAVDWHSLAKGNVGGIFPERPSRERWPAAGPQRLLPGEVRAGPLCPGPAHSFARRWPAGPGARATRKQLRDLALGESCEVSGHERESPLKTRHI